MSIQDIFYAVDAITFNSKGEKKIRSKITVQWNKSKKIRQCKLLSNNLNLEGKMMFVYVQDYWS